MTVSFSSPSFSVVIPAYNRTNELRELLLSVLSQTILPKQVIICEDLSPERELINKLCEEFSEIYSKVDVDLVLVENECNLGYDANLRKCIELSLAEWALIMGNDDLLMPDCIETYVKYASQYNVNMISRSFYRFVNDIDKPIGISKVSENDTVYNKDTSGAEMIFRACGFVGGLAVNVPFAKSLSTDKYDGGLYYQIYLAAHAYSQKGIGYISTPVVGGRAGNPPLFGDSSNESVHVPGGYTAEGRCSMWNSVLNIAQDVGSAYGIDLLSNLKHELMVRQSFHVFEMNTVATRSELVKLKDGLSKLGLMNSVLPKSLFTLNYIFGKYSRVAYWIARKIVQ